MNNDIRRLGEPETSSPMGCLKVFAIVTVATIIASVISVWVIQKFILPDEFKSVVLSVKEEKALDVKIEQLALTRSKLKKKVC